MVEGPSITQRDRWLFMGTGWQWDDAGTWRVTERARADADFMRGRRGHSRRHENRPHDPVLPSQGAEGFRPQELPTPVVCPHCGTPQRLDPEALALEPWQHEHSLSTAGASRARPDATHPDKRVDLVFTDEPAGRAVPAGRAGGCRATGGELGHGQLLTYRSGAVNDR